MITIGFLHPRKDPHRVKKSYAYAAVAMAEGARLLYFSPKGIRWEERTISGHIYEGGQWKPVEHPFPDVIYNTGSPAKLFCYREILDLMRAEIPFTTVSIGNKMRVYERLQKAGAFASYLIPSQYVHSLKGLFDFLNFYRKIVFKPVNGHKGQDIVFIEKNRDGYTLKEGLETSTLSSEELRKFARQKLKEETYLVQPFIHCKTREGVCYDIRLHVQKDGCGKWVINTIYPRFAPGQSIISNINSGGSTNYLEPFLKHEFGKEYYNIKRYLEQFALQFAKHMDLLQKEYFSESIDELGIDVGLDDLQKIWIYEVNWRPGCPPAFYLELDVVKNMIRYAMHLVRLNKAGSENEAPEAMEWGDSECS